MARRTEEKTEENAAEKTEEKAARKILCATCGALTTWENNPWRPFCSERCKLTDLGAWAEEKYAIPSQESPGIFDPED